MVIDFSTTSIILNVTVINNLIKRGGLSSGLKEKKTNMLALCVVYRAQFIFKDTNSLKAKEWKKDML